MHAKLRGGIYINRYRSVAVAAFAGMFFPTTFCLLFRDIIPDNIDEEYNMDIQTVFHVIIGLLFISFGIFWYHRKYSTYYSFKSVWCIKSQENWYATHKFTGIVWIISGIIVFSTLYIRMNDLFFILSALFALMLLTPFVFSFFFHLHQKIKGIDISENEFYPPEEKKLLVITAIIGLVILGFAAQCITTGNIRYKFTSSEFNTSGSYWNDVTVKYKDITNIEFSKEDIPGRRIFGYGGLTTEMGNFYHIDYKYYKQYTYLKNKACIIISYKNDYLIINETDYAKTKKLYKKLCTYLNKSVSKK